MSNLTPGLLESQPDERDFNLGALIAWPKLEELPEAYQVSPLSIKNQLLDGNDDFCASCAGAGSYEPKEEVELFYPYLFAAAKFASGQDPNEWGLRIEEVAKGLQKWGIPENCEVPEEVKNLDSVRRRRFENYPDALKQKAEKHKIKTYFVVKGPYDAYDNVRSAIWYFREVKQFVLFGVKFGWSLGDFELKGIPDGFGHAMWCNGWVKDGLSVINSAGKEAGKNGEHSLSRETFNHYAEIFKPIMCVDLPREDVEEYYLAHGIKLEDNFIVALLKALFSSFFKKLWTH